MVTLCKLLMTWTPFNGMAALRIRRTYLPMHGCSTKICKVFRMFVWIYVRFYFISICDALLFSSFTIFFSSLSLSHSISLTYKILDTDKWRTVYISSSLLSYTHFTDSKKKKEKTQPLSHTPIRNSIQRKHTYWERKMCKGKFIKKNYCRFFSFFCKFFFIWFWVWAIK